MIRTALLIVVFFSLSLLHAQVEKTSYLFRELKTQDSIFFERGFNQCDLDYLTSHIAADLKFYHDQGGFQDRDAFLENTQKYICGGGDKKPIRKVDERSLSVFPLYNNGVLYGAIQQGTHHFYLQEKGKADVWTSTALFTHVWIKQSNKWIISEVLSYSHSSEKAPGDRRDVITKLLTENKVPALGLGVIENGKLTKVEVYGTLDGKATAPYNSVFKVASLTKPVFALTVLKLIDKGLLSLDEPLYKYWVDPDLKGDKRYRKLTPKLILTHQTGFPNWRYMTETGKLSFEFEPGTKYQYSGEGFEYLRKAIENKLNRPIEDLAKEMIFEPAGMHDTRFWWDSGLDEKRYAKNFDEKGKQIPVEKYYEANAAANLLTTVEDYGRFLEYVVNGAGLSKSLYNEMLARQVVLGKDDYFGLGWEILTGFSNDEFALMHTGKDPGVSTLAIFFPKSKNGYLIFLNGDNVNEIYEYLLNDRLYLGNELWGKR